MQDRATYVEAEVNEEPVEVALLGFYRTASALVAELEKARDSGDSAASSVLKGIVVVDFNPEMHRQLHARNIRAVYGDIAHLDTLHHAGVHAAKIIVITLPDTILKGTSNRKLLQQLRTLCPHSLVICTAESHAQSIDLYQSGADFVLQARRLEAERLVAVIADMRAGKSKELRDRETDAETHRDEILG
jgi:voltage-gated potassium channel Kch